MDGNSCKPCGKRCAAFELREVLIRADVSILHDVFCLVAITQNRYDHTVEPLIITTHDDFVEVGLAGQYALDDLFVRPAFDSSLLKDLHAHTRGESLRAAKGYISLSLSRTGRHPNRGYCNETNAPHSVLLEKMEQRNERARSSIKCRVVGAANWLGRGTDHYGRR